jgi:hypothetical protein
MEAPWPSETTTLRGVTTQKTKTEIFAAVKTEHLSLSHHRPTSIASAIDRAEITSQADTATLAYGER